MKKIPVIAIAAIAFFGIYLYSKKSNATTVKNSARFSIYSFKLQGTNILLGLKITNPTNLSLAVQKIIGSLFINGNAVANIQNFEGVNITANGATNVVLTLIPRGLQILTALSSLLQPGKLKNSNVVFQGIASGENWSIPINQRIV